MKLATNIYHMSGHCCKGFQGQRSNQRSKVKVTTREQPHFSVRGVHFDGVASRLTSCLLYYCYNL